jgi:hypothetical protein
MKLSHGSCQQLSRSLFLMAFSCYCFGRLKKSHLNGLTNPLHGSLFTTLALEPSPAAQVRFHAVRGLSWPGRAAFTPNAEGRCYAN